MKVNKHLVDIYRKDTIEKSKLEQAFTKWYDNYTVNPLLTYFTPEDIAYIHKLAISPAMHCNIMEKYRLLGELMEKRGFKLIGGGTNRRSYECLFDNRIVAKVATDQIGFTSNLREYVNQNVMRPFCCKIFEVTPCGTLAIIEKIVPIKDVAEFQKYAPEIFDVLYFKIRNNSIALEDIGTRSMKNWGYRSGFGPVLLDYPTMYVADPAKRFCKDLINGCTICGGTLDYDDGFNTIVCSECRRTYFAKTIAKKDGDKISSLLNAVGYQKKNEGVLNMRVKIIDLETKEVVEERNIGGKNSYVESTNSTFRQRNNSFVPKTVAQPVPKRKVRIIDTGEILNKTETVPVVKVNHPVTEERKVKVVETPYTPVVPNSKKEQFINAFNSAILNVNGDNYPTDGHTMSEDEFIQKCQSFMNSSDCHVDENEAFQLYRKISMATMIGECQLSDDTLGTADTYINRFLKKILPYSDGWEAFYLLVNKIRNTRDLFNHIVIFWYKLLEIYCFDEDETADYTTYCVYNDYYEIYVRAVERALHDYTVNVTFGGNMSYNKKNSLAILGTAIGDIDSEARNDYEFYNNNNRVEYVTFTIGETFAEQMIADVVIPNQSSDKVETVTEEVPVVDTTGIPEPMDKAEASKPVVETIDIPNGKEMSRKQQNRYNGGGKKNKKNKKRR